MSARNKKTNPKTGVSLIEATIALTIAGLLVAGIFSGNHLITTANYRTLLQDVSRFEEATSQFKERFKYLPGDFPSATLYWNTATGNGDGDWKIEETAETLNAWEHLSLAELLSSPMDGVPTPSSIIPGRNMPRTPFGNGNGVYELRTHTTAIYGFTGHAIDAALANIPATDSIAHFGLFTAKDAYTIDLKIDDGLASQGYMFASWGDNISTSSCVDNNPSSGSATYQLNDTTASCRLHFWFDRRPNKD